MNRATLIGLTAVLLWSSLALFTVGTAPMRPFQLAALTFGIGGLVGLGWIETGRGVARLGHVPARACPFDALALFGYHAP